MDRIEREKAALEKQEKQTQRRMLAHVRGVPVEDLADNYYGYHGNDDATRASQRDGFFSVGDVGRIDADGYYYLQSRKHDMVISGGVNIYPGEIEDHLSSHPAILEAAVIGVPDPEWGETLRAFMSCCATVSSSALHRAYGD